MRTIRDARASMPTRHIVGLACIAAASMAMVACGSDDVIGGSGGEGAEGGTAEESGSGSADASGESGSASADAGDDVEAGDPLLELE